MRGLRPGGAARFYSGEKTGKRAQKYQYEENGILKKWSGVERMPVVIQQALNAGKSLDSFLIENSNE
ncbi:H-NS family nucleoid-associated regulatory protein [Klebsiella pneumoniae]|uniref:H-NS family nucleoid-associated regulatory protein n=1 Tax=Klebsiella pneumoniae TaxID=573 RepID=UPI003A10371F